MFPGRFPGFRVIIASSAFPFCAGQNSGRQQCLGGCGSPITVAGPRPILTAFPFPPWFKRGTAGTRVVKNPTTHWKLSPAEQRCQWGLTSDRSGNWLERWGNLSRLYRDAALWRGKLAATLWRSNRGAMRNHGGIYRPLRGFSSPIVRVYLSSPGRACTLRISCVTGRAAIRGIEAANGKGETTHASRGTQIASRPSAQSG